MFLPFEQVILVQDQGKRRPEDTIVYLYTDKKIRAIKRGDDLDEVVWDKTLWPDFGGNKELYFESGWKHMTQYGTIYEDANGQWCVVPDVWSEEDAQLAKQVIRIPV